MINFISIMVFIFLGTTLFQGLNYAGNAIQYSIDRTYQSMNSYDVKLRVGGLLTSEDLTELNSIEGVSDIEGYFSVNDDFVLNGIKYNCSVESITERISTPYVWEGSLPSNDQEIAVTYKCAEELGIKVGDEISFTRTNPAAFIQTLARDYPTQEMSDLAESDLTNFKNQTFTVSALIGQSEHLNHNASAHGLDMTVGGNVKANFYVNYSAFNPFIAGQRYNAAYIINDEINSKKYFDQAYIDEASALSKRVNSYIENNCDFSLDYVTLFNQNEDLIESTALGLALTGKITYDQYLQISTHKDVVLDYAESLTKVEKIVVLTTKEHLASTLFSYTLYNLFTNEKWACGGTFFIISLLICYSVIRRLVNNDVKLIGTKKALGFTKKEITRTYLGFSLIAALIGLVLGICAAVGLESVFAPLSLKNHHQLLYYVTYFEPINTLILVAVLVGLISLITYISCRTTLNRKPISLLAGDIKISKRRETLIEKTKAFQRTSFINKTIFRNFKNNLNHIVATIVGISSCIALMMASLTLKTSVNDSFSKQNAMFLYDTTINIDTRVEGGAENIEQYLTDNDYTYAAVAQEAITFRFPNEPVAFGNLVVYFDDASFNNVAKLEASKGGDKFNNKGFWFPESYKHEYGLSDQNDVNVSSSSGLNLDITTAGFIEYHYFDGLVFVDSETFEEITGTSVAPNSFLVIRGSADFSKIRDDLKTINGYSSIDDTISTSRGNVKVFNSVTTIIFILFSSATLMLSVFVILNLLLTQIKEKKRELITLMVNGYSRKDASKYVYFDTIILTIISVIVGVGVGLGLSWFTESSLESQAIYLLHRFNFLVMGVAIVTTVLLVIIMSLISLNEIKKFKLKDIQDA